MCASAKGPCVWNWNDHNFSSVKRSSLQSSVRPSSLASSPFRLISLLFIGKLKLLLLSFSRLAVFCWPRFHRPACSFLQIPASNVVLQVGCWSVTLPNCVQRWLKENCSGIKSQLSGDPLLARSGAAKDRLWNEGKHRQEMMEPRAKL